MEPPVADVPARPLPKPDLLTLGRQAAAGAAAGMAVFSAGSAVVVCGLLALAAGDAALTAVAACVVVVELARFGTESMTAIGGAQSVLAPAVLAGPVLGGLASLAALSALAMAVPTRRLAVPVAISAVALTAAPGLTGPVAVVTRLVVMVVVAALVWRGADLFHADARPAVAVGAVAALLALVSHPHGALRLGGLLVFASPVLALTAAVVGGAVALALARR